MRILTTFTLSTILILSTNPIAYANPPFIDYQWVPWRNGNQENCINKAKETMQNMEFVISPSTGIQEIVGYKGNYKSVVACLVDYDLVLFIVAGPIYKKAELIGKKLKNNF